ncbi:MAG: hypothetical protein ACLFWL_14150 [Candidatus Brocadiia bacterium]
MINNAISYANKVFAQIGVRIVVAGKIEEKTEPEGLRDVIDISNDAHRSTLSKIVDDDYWHTLDVIFYYGILTGGGETENFAGYALGYIPNREPLVLVSGMQFGTVFPGRAYFKRELGTILAHEISHALGIRADYDDSTALMYPKLVNSEVDFWSDINAQKRIGPYSHPGGGGVKWDDHRRMRDGALYLRYWYQREVKK